MQDQSHHDRGPGPDDPSGSMIRFRQLGVLIIAILGLLEAVVIVIGVATGDYLMTILVMAVVGPILGIFHALTIEVSVDHVRCFFGPGFPSRTIPVERIRRVRALRTRVIDGWGIRLVRGGRMWNVSGFDAVELELEGGRVFQMGTDRPAEVVEAIEAVIGVG